MKSAESRYFHEDLDRRFIIDKPTSGDISMVRVRTYSGELGYNAVRKLIKSSEHGPNQPSRRQPPYEFAGLHAGMAQGDVWAMTRDGSEIDQYLPAIADCVAQAIDARDQTAKG